MIISMHVLIASIYRINWKRFSMMMHAIIIYTRYTTNECYTDHDKDTNTHNGESVHFDGKRGKNACFGNVLDP